MHYRPSGVRKPNEAIADLVVVDRRIVYRDRQAEIARVGHSAPSAI
jgi:hypothetical protein